MALGTANRTKSNSFRSSKPSDDKLRQMVEKKAYELFEKRGCNHGSDVNDWLEAERIVKRQFRLF